MTEALDGLDKWELIYHSQDHGPASTTWSSPPLGYIDWFNHRRLHDEVTDDNTYVTPAGFEASYYRQEGRLPEMVVSK